MKIGIIGSGVVGQTLAKAFLAEGYTVQLGTRNTLKEELIKFKKENTNIHLGTFAETAIFADIIVLATAGAVTLDAIELAGKENFTKKVVIDTTNPILKEPPVNGVLKFFTDYNNSLLEKIQSFIPDANIVKAFSCVGNAFFYKPYFNGTTPTMFIAGNNIDAKKLVTGILTTFGWETEDMGMAEAARAIEPLCILWCLPRFTKNQWGHAFKLLKL